MKITRDVIQDLLPAFVAGEASADTTALVEEFLRGDPELTRCVERMRANPLPEVTPGLAPTHEVQALKTTRRRLRRQSLLLATAAFLTGLPLSFEYNFATGQFRWLFMDQPRIGFLMTVSAGLFWLAYLWTKRETQSVWGRRSDVRE